MTRSSKLAALCSLSIALCGACEQGAGEPSLPVDSTAPAATGGVAGPAAPAGQPGAVDPTTPAPAGQSPAPNAPAPAGASAAASPPGVVTPEQPPPYPGLPTGPALPVDPVNQLERFVPTDSRVAQQALQAAPISGGTLLITADGTTAVAADPERDRVSIVDLATTWVLAQVALQAGDEPGRLVQDNASRVHVALRRAGAVASIDLRTLTVVARRAVCASPRGIAFDPSTQMLKVACAGGELVELPAASGEVASRVHVDSDLRDVIPTQSGTFVTRLKSAELLRLGAPGAALQATRPATPSFFFPDTDGSQVVDSLEPVGARRTLASLDGGVIMLHQGARNGDIAVSSADDSNAGVASSAYGGTGSCTGVVTTSITRFDALGKPNGTIQISGVLAVDIAESAQSPELAVAFAGAADPRQPVSQLVLRGDVPPPQVDPLPSDLLETSSVLQFERAAFDLPQTPGAPSCVNPLAIVSLPAPATALAYAGDRLVVQTREPAALFIVNSAFNAEMRERIQIDLGGASMLDTGHEIFHRDAGAGVACASCHIEGGDDGHVWHFVDQGPRRTQSMLIGLEGTAPFHWVGDMSDLGTLMEHVFVGRMGGVHQAPARMVGLEKWLNAIEVPPPLRAANDPAVGRGHALFDGEAKCNECHSGAKLTNNKTVDVGTGLALQVPSLVGVAYRGPWIHTGCAATLRDRFDPACGGDKHGDTAQLSDAQLADLVAYLEAL